MAALNPMLPIPAFTAYGVTAVVLVVHLQAIWLYSAFVRGKSGTAPNAEDAARRKLVLREGDPPEVARVLRVHANGQATVLPFLLLGLVYVIGGGSAEFAGWDFGVFAAARILHSMAYLTGRQPWRTIFYITSMAALVTLVVAVVMLLAHG